MNELETSSPHNIKLTLHLAFNHALCAYQRVPAPQLSFLFQNYRLHPHFDYRLILYQEQACDRSVCK